MKRSVLGLILVAIGCLFLLRNLGWIPDITYYIFRWPNFLFLIAIGLLVSGKPKPALVFVIIGGVFLAQDYFHFAWEIFWPVILIALGIIFFIRQSPSSTGDPAIDDNTIDETTIFSGSKKKFTSDQFRGGKITTLFAGTELDLREAKLTEDAEIDLFCMFGGAEIKAPNDWKVNVDTTPIFGGVSDERDKEEQTGPILRVTGFVMFGGVEIKS